jgi:hypothetical protein
MPLDFHVYDGPKIPDSVGGQEKYATDPNSATQRDPGSLTAKEKFILGKHKIRSLMRYKDHTAYYCRDCEYVFNVTCPQCHAKSKPVHGCSISDPMFDVPRPAVYDKYEWFIWVKVVCLKCDFGFKVIVRD